MSDKPRKGLMREPDYVKSSPSDTARPLKGVLAAATKLAIRDVLDTDFPQRDHAREAATKEFEAIYKTVFQTEDGWLVDRLKSISIITRAIEQATEDLRSQLAVKDAKIAKLREYADAQTEAFRHASDDGIAAEAENKRLREALENYATCCDGCTCGDGWNHDVARAALARLEEE